MAQALSQDVIFEVLSRLPVKSLIRFKATCKAWLALISEPYFIASHYKRSRANPSLLILPLKQDIFQETVDLYSYKKEARVSELLLQRKLPCEDRLLALYPCQVNGIIMLFSERSFHICNPSTKEFLTLSPPYSDHAHHCVGFGLDSSTNKYKVVRVFLRSFDENTQDYDLGCEIFTLGDGSWRTIDGPPCTIVRNCPATVGEVVYWPTYKKEHGMAILQFSLRDETFGVVPGPPLKANENYVPSDLVALEGDLGYVDRRVESYTVDIWALNACNNTWSKKYNIDCSNFGLMTVEAADDRKILLSSGNRLAYFDPRSKTWTAVLAIGGAPNDKYPWKQACMSFLDGSLHFFVAPFAESLVSVTTGSH
ncbi:F-box protein CPR1-like [Elaeis guineensis]|uniref:F-box protein At1g47790 n=1 Tax=Elaeis guineensis var. tenera TaxID=51953 RepID=A0A6I9RMB9_ELAGV|nr:putative F-box protein At1g47790 [Elaeis guineensis]